jgi:hypothetical protein
MTNLAIDGYVSSASALANFRNLIDGGDFTVNPWQRGTSFTGIANTLAYGADRFFAVGGASSSISMSKQANTDVAGFSQALQWGRANGNANTAVLNLGQVLETADSIRMQAQPVTLSFYAKGGANAPAAVNVQLIAGTGADQSAANMVAGSWTGQNNVISSSFAPTTTTIGTHLPARSRPTPRNSASSSPMPRRGPPGRTSGCSSWASSSKPARRRPFSSTATSRWSSRSASATSTRRTSRPPASSWRRA